MEIREFPLYGCRRTYKSDVNWTMYDYWTMDPLEDGDCIRVSIRGEDGQIKKLYSSAGFDRAHCNGFDDPEAVCRFYDPNADVAVYPSSITVCIDPDYLHQIGPHSKLIIHITH